MKKFIINSILFISGWLIIYNIDILEMLVYNSIQSWNLMITFYTVRIISSALLLTLPIQGINAIIKGKYKIILKSILIVFCIVIPFILSPPDCWSFKQRKTSIEQQNYLHSFLDKRKEIQTDNSLLCFISANCKFCQLVGKKLNKIHNKINQKDRIKLIIHNNHMEVTQFLNKANLPLDFPYYKISVDSLLKICGGRMPTIYLMNKDSIVNEYNSRSFNDTEIINNLTLN